MSLVIWIPIVFTRGDSGPSAAWDWLMFLGLLLVVLGVPWLMMSRRR